MLTLPMICILAMQAVPPPEVGAAFSEDAVTGRAVALVDGGQIIFARGYGLADRAGRRPVDADTVFRAGSVGKSLVGVAVMMLVEENKLRLADKLADLAPEIPFDNPWEATAPIRLEHLLEHTTGWADLSPREFALDDPDMSLLDGIRAGGTRLSRYPPGLYHAYSGAGHSIAAYVVEKTAGAPFHEFVRARIFQPLDMRTATFRQAPHITRSYLPDGSATPYQHYPLYPSGGLNLSITDLAKFVAFLADGGRGLLQPDSMRRLQRARTTLAARAGLEHGYSLGITSYVGRAKVLLGHGGAIDSFQALYRYDPESRRGFAVMVNAGDIPAAAMGPLNAFLGEWGEPPAVDGISAAPFAHFAGTYQPFAQRNRITPLLDSLTTFIKVDVRDSELTVGGMPRIVLPGGLLQPRDRIAPTMVLVKAGESPQLLAATASYRRVSQTSVLAKLVYGALFVFALVSAIIAVIADVARKLLTRAGTAGIVAFGPALALVGVMMAATSMPSPVSIHLFGNATWLSVSVFLLTLLVPIAAIYGLFAAFATGRGGRWARGTALLSGAVNLIAAAYLASYGWIGLRTW